FDSDLLPRHRQHYVERKNRYDNKTNCPCPQASPQRPVEFAFLHLLNDYSDGSNSTLDIGLLGGKGRLKVYRKALPVIPALAECLLSSLLFQFFSERTRWSSYGLLWNGRTWRLQRRLAGSHIRTRTLQCFRRRKSLRSPRAQLCRFRRV